MTDESAERAFYRKHGYYERQGYNPDERSTYIAWAHDFDNRPRDDRSSDPKNKGVVEWLRFIHAMNDTGVFTSRSFLWIDPTGQLTDDGERLYAENYIDTETNNLLARVFLHNGAGRARIEIYDPNLYDAAQKALLEVEASYEKVPA